MGVRQKALRRQLETIPASAGDAAAADVEFSPRADRRKLPVPASSTYTCVLARGRPIGTRWRGRPLRSARPRWPRPWSPSGRRCSAAARGYPHSGTTRPQVPPPRFAADHHHPQRRGYGESFFIDGDRQLMPERRRQRYERQPPLRTLEESLAVEHLIAAEHERRARMPGKDTLLPRGRRNCPRRTATPGRPRSAIRGRRSPHVAHHGPVLDHHPLGMARGAGRVDQVCQILSRKARRRPMRGATSDLRPSASANHMAPTAGQITAEILPRDDDLRPRIPRA